MTWNHRWKQKSIVIKINEFKSKLRLIIIWNGVIPVELEKRVKPDEEEIFTDYEKFIDEEMEEALPVVIAKEIPEVPREERREISEDAALYEGIDRERAVRPPRERAVTTAIPEEREEITIISAPANSVRAKRRAVRDACDETCPLVREQKGELAYFYKKTVVS